MKKFISILTCAIAAIVFGACSEELESNHACRIQKLRSQDEAIAIAKNAYSIFNTKDSRSGSKVNVDKNGVHVIKGRSSRGIKNDTLLYVVNYTDNSGFAIVSASNATEPLIGIAEEGSYNPNQDLENPNFQFYLDNACEYIGNTMSQSSSSSYSGISFPTDSIGPNLPPVNPTLTTDLYRVLQSKGPYVDLKWGQGYPYGNRFRNGKCSSIPCVVAMIATYLHRPNRYQLDNHTVNWEELYLHKSIGEGCTEPDYAHVHSEIADLIYQISADIYGITVGDSTFFYSEYPLNFVSCITGYQGSCLNGYDLEDDECVIGVLNEYETSLKRLVYAVESYTKVIDGAENTFARHCWLIDGYKTIQMILLNANPVTYYHCNWACDGDSNGFFLSSLYFNNGVLSYDSSNHNFTPQLGGAISYHEVHPDCVVGIN